VSIKNNLMFGVSLLMEEELYRKVTRLETKVEEHDRKLDAQVEKNESLTRLATLMQLQMEESKERERRQEIRDDKQNKQMEKFSETLTKVNDNLTNLNTKQQSLTDRVSEIEGTLSGQKIDIVKLLKGMLSYLLTAAGGGVVLYIYIKLGIK
jgi:chromosome segregation ATPase